MEYLELDQSGIHVSQYLPELPPKELMEEKLHNAYKLAQQNHEKKLIDCDNKS